MTEPLKRVEGRKDELGVCMNIKELINRDNILSVSGAVFVAFGMSFIANCIWSIGNVFLIRRNYINKDYSQVFMFSVFEIVCVVGVINHLFGVY